MRIDYHQAVRETVAMCDVCLADIPAEVVPKDDRVFLVKRCPVHGERSVLMSTHADGYLRLDRGYHRLFPLHQDPPPREDTYFFLTNACNQNCPYCLTEANRYPYFTELGRNEFQEHALKHEGSKISLIGGEPLVHPDFLYFARRVGEMGKTLVLYTNGLGLADESLVRDLVAAAPRLEVRMTFEGFEEDNYRHLAVRGVRQRKLDALANLDRYRIPTTLGHTILPDEDPTQVRESIRRLVEYAKSHDFIRGLTFQAALPLGSARNAGYTDPLSVDRVMDLVLDAIPHACDHSDAYLIQQMVHLLAAIFDLPVCEYVQTAVLFREGEAWVDLGYYLHRDRLRLRLDRLFQAWPMPRWKAFLRLGIAVLASARPARLFSLIGQALRILPVFTRRYDFASIPKSVLPLISITVCDPTFADHAVARRCEKQVHSKVDGRIVTELSSEMVLRHVRQRFGSQRTDGAER